MNTTRPISTTASMAPGASLGSYIDFFIARYSVSTLALDTTFDGDGVLNTDFSSGNDVAYAVALQPDGKIVAAGYKETPGSGGASDFALARYKVPAGLDERRFAQHDPSFNIVSVTDANGQVAERYVYQPYGAVTVVDPAWRVPGGGGGAFALRLVHSGERWVGHDKTDH